MSLCCPQKSYFLGQALTLPQTALAQGDALAPHCQFPEAPPQQVHTLWKNILAVARLSPYCSLEKLQRKSGQIQGVPKTYRERPSCKALRGRTVLPTFLTCAPVPVLGLPPPQQQTGQVNQPHPANSLRPCSAKLTPCGGILWWQSAWAHVVVVLEKLSRRSGQTQGEPKTHRKRLSSMVLGEGHFSQCIQQVLLYLGRILLTQG